MTRQTCYWCRYIPNRFKNHQNTSLVLRLRLQFLLRRLGNYWNSNRTPHDAIKYLPNYATMFRISHQWQHLICQVFLALFRKKVHCLYRPFLLFSAASHLGQPGGFINAVRTSPMAIRSGRNAWFSASQSLVCQRGAHPDGHYMGCCPRGSRPAKRLIDFAVFFSKRRAEIYWKQIYRKSPR